MKIYFCPECGAYEFSYTDVCHECQEPLPEDNWADVSDEDLTQLDYIEEFDTVDGVTGWEYEVIKLKSSSNGRGADDQDVLEQTRVYNEHLLNRMGDKGWELVNIVPMGDESGHGYGVFKRAWLDEFEE